MLDNFKKEGYNYVPVKRNEFEVIHLHDDVLMVDYGVIYEDAVFKQDNYRLEDFYCKSTDCDCTDVRFGVWEKGREVGEVWYDYEKDEVDDSDYQHLVTEMETEDKLLLQTIAALRHEVVRKDFKIFCLENEIKERRMKLAALGDKEYVPQKKIGRNEPCPCGSRKKYKKCCINK